MKKIIIFVFLIFIGIIVMYLYINISNDEIAKKLEKKLLSTDLPNNTEIIDSISVSGKLVGNGNGMQYFGAILIKTDLSKNDLDEYYNQFRENEWSYIIVAQKSSKIEVIEHGNYKFNKYNPLNNAEKEKYYMIYSWGVSKNNFLQETDVRGH